ncbi:MAG: P63C domain-containing protein [Microcoleus sp.]
MSSTKITLFDSLTKELHCNDAGEGFVSLRGLARMCGVNHQSWGKRGGSQFSVEIDEYLTEYGINVADAGGNNGIPDTIASMVIGFYAEEKQNETAKKYSRAFRAYGLRKAIQEVVGYSSAEPRIYRLGEILRRTPANWELMFEPEWIAEAEKITGWKWSYRCMGRFINDCVYAYLPDDVVEVLKGLNPASPFGRRSHKHHQFLQPDIRKKVVSHLQTVQTLMQVSDGDMDFFETLMIKKFGNFKRSDNDNMPLFESKRVFILKHFG